MEGYIHLHRSLLDSQIFASEKGLKIWVWLLLKASFKERFVPVRIGKGEQVVKLQRGELLFGRFTAEESLGIDGSTIYRWLKKMEEMEMVSLKSNSHYTVLTINNYNGYNDIDIVNVATNELPLNNHCTTNELPLNTNKKDNNVEERKENTLKKIQKKNSGEAVAAGFTPKKQKNTLTPPHSAAPPLSLFKKALEMYPSVKEGSVEVLYDKFRDYCIKYGKDIETEVVAFKEGVHRYAMLYRKQRDKKAADPKYFYKETYSAKDFISLGRWTESFDDVIKDEEKRGSFNN